MSHISGLDAATQHIAMAYLTRDDLTDETRSILIDICSEFTCMIDDELNDMFEDYDDDE